MFDICLLGTGGMMPLPGRFLTSCIMRYHGTCLLIDCGEGTQITLRELGWSFKAIDYVLFTHFHGDHISGLPGLLLTIGNCERTEPVTLIGPRGLKKIAQGLLLIAPGLPFPIRYIELTNEQIAAMQEMALGDLCVRPFQADHGVSCVGYSVEVKRRPQFDPVRAKEAGIPLPYWRRLQNGETITEPDGTYYDPSMVLGPPRKGLKVTYCTDSRPTASIVKAAEHSDLLICEGMYGEPDKQEKASQHKHMSYREAATIADKAQVGELWLTHFSPAMPNPRHYLNVATAIFKNTKVGKDRMTKEFKFREEES